MKGFVQEIESLSVKNNKFHKLPYTAKDFQLVIMSLNQKEDIGAWIHKVDQFFCVEEGSGEAVLNGVRMAVQAGFALLVLAGTNHNIKALVLVLMFLDFQGECLNGGQYRSCK